MTEPNEESIHQWSTDRWCVYTAGLLAQLDRAHNIIVPLRTENRALRAERARARAFLLEATGTLPFHGFTNDERGDPWVRWVERVAAYLTETHR